MAGRKFITDTMKDGLGQYHQLELIEGRRVELRWTEKGYFETSWEYIWYEGHSEDRRVVLDGVIDHPYRDVPSMKAVLLDIQRQLSNLVIEFSRPDLDFREQKE